MTAAPFRVGVVGLGFGALIHVPALRAIPGVEVTAIAGTTRARAQAAAARLGIAAACAGIDELIDRELDAVTLALPPDVNETALARALDRPLAILSEKPLGCTADVATRLAADAAGRTTAVGFEFADLETFGALKKFVAAETLGPVRAVDIAWMHQSRAHLDRVWSWKSDPRRGGGVLALLGSHVLYLAEWLFGPIAQLRGRLDAAASQILAPAGAEAAEDTAHLEFTFAGGPLGSADLSNVAPGTPIHRWHVVFARGTALLENAGTSSVGSFCLTVRDEAGRILLQRDEPAAGGDDGRLPPFRRLAARFVAAARTGTACTPDFSAGARVQYLMQMARDNSV